MIKRVTDLIKIPFFAITVILITFLGVFFDLPLLIPPFVGSLYVIFLYRRNTKLKDLLGAHLIGFICAFFQFWTKHFFDWGFLRGDMGTAVLLGVAIFLTGAIMAILKLNHAPAIATSIVFFNIPKKGALLFHTIPMSAAIAFFIGLTVIGLLGFFILRKEK